VTRAALLRIPRLIRNHRRETMRTPWILCFLSCLVIPVAGCPEGDDCGPTCQYDDLATLDDLTLPAESHFTADATGLQSFASGEATFLHYYDNSYGMDYWEGFTYTDETDTTTADYTNQYSAIPGGGQGGSANYAVGYTAGFTAAAEIWFPDSVTGVTLGGVYVTNTTYAYLSMRDGDAYAKQFGGPDGTDPDWFRLTITGLDADGSTLSDVVFYLADFRSDDPAEDYLVDEWTFVDLSTLGPVHGLRFALDSSDVGEYGMNTPAYFALDTLLTAD
jgi:hypothetical protein